MGIPGMFEYVKKACRETHVWEFHGKTLGVDMSGLIHRAINVKKNDSLQAQADHVMMYVLAMQKHCKLYLVFDGKAPKNKMRKREITEEKSESEAVKEEKPVITREIVSEIKKNLDKMSNVTIVQAPSEADPQLAFMALNGFIDAVVTEDSDLIVYGCEKVIFLYLFDISFSRFCTRSNRSENAFCTRNLNLSLKSTFRCCVGSAY